MSTQFSQSVPSQRSRVTDTQGASTDDMITLDKINEQKMVKLNSRLLMKFLEGKIVQLTFPLIVEQSVLCPV